MEDVTDYLLHGMKNVYISNLQRRPNGWSRQGQAFMQVVARQQLAAAGSRAVAGLQVVSGCMQGYTRLRVPTVSNGYILASPRPLSA